MTGKDFAREAIAATLTAAMLVGLPVAVVAYHRHVIATEAHGRRVIDLYASAKDGYWLREPIDACNYFRAHAKPGPIQVRRGEPLLLRITSRDVHHGFSIRQLRIKSHDVTPGRWTEVEVPTDEPGLYTIACFTVCGERHVYMEGELEVVDK
jgi:heme/copper-type cytochrome/quinol oxidase subunit 2